MPEYRPRRASINDGTLQYKFEAGGWGVRNRSNLCDVIKEPPSKVPNIFHFSLAVFLQVTVVRVVARQSAR